MGEMPTGLRVCVYTVLVGNYELLNEQPVTLNSTVPFICLTDDPELRSETWTIKHIDLSFPRDPIRSQRDVKIRPHVYLPEFDRSLYIDNSIILKSTPERIIGLAGESPEGFLMPWHSYRETLLDEFLEVVRIGLDEGNRIFEQLNHYLLTCPQVLEERPWWSGLMVRDHHNARLRRALEIWALHVMRYARRDQLSVNVAFHAAGIQPLRLQIDTYESEFHSWPHTRGRDRDRGERNLALSMMPLSARLRLAEVRLRVADEQREAQEAKIANMKTREGIEFRSLREKYQKEIADLQEAHQLEFNTIRDQLEGAIRDLQRSLRDSAAQHELCEGRLGALLKDFEKLSADYAVMQQSTSWLLTQPLRRLGQGSPTARAVFRAALRPLRRLASGRSRSEGSPGADSPTATPLAMPDRVRSRAGHWIYVDPRDARGRHLIDSGGALTPITLAAWKRLLAEANWTHVVDVGANYGEMLVDGGLPRGARVIAIEPNPLIRTKLERTLLEARIEVEVLGVALSDKEGEATLRVDDEWSGRTRISHPHENGGIPVSVTTLESIIKDRTIDISDVCIIVKIDVEGNEVNVLKGISGVLETFEEFVAMIEILHLKSEDLRWLQENFDVQFIDVRNDMGLVPATAESFEEMLVSDTYYHQDVILRRRRSETAT